MRYLGGYSDVMQWAADLNIEIICIDSDDDDEQGLFVRSCASYIKQLIDDNSVLWFGRRGGLQRNSCLCFSRFILTCREHDVSR